MAKIRKPGVKPLTMRDCRKIESKLKKMAKKLNPAEERELKRFIDEGLARARKTGTPPNAATELRLLATWFAKQEVKKKRR